jgi:hypothetical protein
MSDQGVNDSSGARAGKGRPTPKRKEAEAKRIKRSLAPATGREAMKAQRAESRRLRGLQREAMMRGDEAALAPRDRGPIKRLARDMVDARRSVAEFLLPVVFTVLFLSLIRNPQIQIFATLVMYSVMIASIIDATLLVRRVKKRAAAQFPGISLKGLNSYVILRASQIRRLRIPRPRVTRGTKL